jgi:hypothetical protein
MTTMMHSSCLLIMNNAIPSYHWVWLPRSKTWLAAHLKSRNSKTRMASSLHASILGMLVFLMNTFMSLCFAVRKLAKFVTRPGHLHGAAAAAHLLQHALVASRITLTSRNHQ